MPDHAFQVYSGGRADPAATTDEGSPTAARGLFAAVLPVIAAAAPEFRLLTSEAPDRSAAASVFAAPEDAPPALTDPLFEMFRFRSAAPYLTKRARGADVVLVTPLIGDIPPTGALWNRYAAALTHMLSALGRRRVLIATPSLDGELAERVRASGLLAHFSCTTDFRVALETAPNMVGELATAPARFDTIIAPPGLGATLAGLLGSVIEDGPLTPRVGVGLETRRFDAAPTGPARLSVQDVRDPSALILAGAWLLRAQGSTGAADRLEEALDATIAQGAHTGDRSHCGVNGRALDTDDFVAEVRRRLSSEDASHIASRVKPRRSEGVKGPRLVWSRDEPQASPSSV